MRLDQLAVERAQMLGQATAPARRDMVTGLQQRTPPRRLAAARRPGMAAMLARQQLDDQAALAMPPRRQHKSRVAPLHLGIVIETERGVALRILDPVFPDLDEQEQVDAALEHAFQLGPRPRADCFDALPAVAED